MRKQLFVFGTWNSSYTQKKNDWQIAMNAISSGKIDVSSIITHRFKLEKCEKAFEMLKNKKEFYSKVMFTID